MNSRSRNTTTAVALLGALAMVTPLAAPARRAASPVIVTISDTAVTLSKRAAPVGRVVFDVRNTGRRPREFRVAGAHTPVLAPGRHTALVVDFRAVGAYPYSAFDSARAGRRLTGAFTVVEAPTPAATSTASNQPPPASMTGTPCTDPTSSTVTVTMTDVAGSNGFVFSPATFPCGTVTFVMTNIGQSPHLLQVTYRNVANIPASPIVDPNKTVTFTVTLPVSGTYGWDDGYVEGPEMTYGNLTVQ